MFYVKNLIQGYNIKTKISNFKKIFLKSFNNMDFFTTAYMFDCFKDDNFILTQQLFDQNTNNSDLK